MILGMVVSVAATALTFEFLKNYTRPWKPKEIQPNFPQTTGLSFLSIE